MTMDVREKLVELLRVHPCSNIDCCSCDKYRKDCWLGELADKLIANGVTVTDVTDNNVGNKWIPVTEKLPEAETEVLILASRKIYSLKSHSHTTHHIITTGMYEDGTKRTEDSNWWWETDGFEYDEERDDYIIPEGWWEYKHYNGDEQHNYAVDNEVTHWMPLPEPPKGEQR